MPANTHLFPPGFVWGAATAAYQIEGGYQEDGKGQSIWDHFCHIPGKIANNDTGDYACDHVHLWPQDVALMRSLGLKHYRMSLSWPRILPKGYGQVNPGGLDYYHRLIDGLLAAGITPWVTLYHWDLPQHLQDRGGWPSRDTAKAFAEYAEKAGRAFGDRVKHWMTLNEPAVTVWCGHIEGNHAPGIRDPRLVPAVAHHQLLAHGWAVPILRRDSLGSQVGIALNVIPMYPASTSDLDDAAARRQDNFQNRLYLDPLSGRDYPTELPAEYMPTPPPVQNDDLPAIAAPLDFVGLNYYTRQIVRSKPVLGRRNKRIEVKAGPDVTEMGWEIYPDGLYDLLTRMKRDYAFPAYYITENGAAYADEVGPNGEVYDPKRIDYLVSHLDAAERAIADGVPLKGYFQWSLMDNFEWSFGFTKRFGMVYVDYATQKRIPKASATWYSRVMAENGIVG
jgi:beta-glucosidase